MAKVLIIDPDERRAAALQAAYEAAGLGAARVGALEEALRGVQDPDVELVLATGDPAAACAALALRERQPAGTLALLALAAGGAAPGWADDALEADTPPAEVVAWSRGHVRRLALCAERDQALRLVVHDARNALQALRTDVAFALDALRQQGPLEPDVGEALADAEQAALRLADRLHAILGAGRGEPGARSRSIDASALVRAVTRPVARRLGPRGVEVRLELGPGALVEGIADLLERCLENLLDNAATHVPDGGRVLVRAARRGGEVLVEIGNSGPPVSPELRARLFEPYATGRPGAGTGLGLYMCRVVTELHGGRVEVTDEPGLPALFRLTLPAAGGATGDDPSP